MAQIKIDLAEPLLDGMDIKFQAPCDCTGVTGLTVHYPGDEGIDNQSFVFKDTHGNVLTGQGNLFVKGAYVKVIVDVPNGIAYFQNADTNGYLEARFDEKMDVVTGAASTIVDTNLTPSRAMASDVNGKVCATNVTAVELGYLSGAKSNIQAQLDGKAAANSYLALSGGVMTGGLTVNGLTLTEGVDYDDSLPLTAPKGKLFFVKVGS